MPERSRSTLIYFLLAAVISLVGVVLAGWGALTDDNGQPRSATVVSIGTSLLAGGLASIGFGVLRHFDDRDEVARHIQLEAHRDTIIARVDELREEVGRIGTEVTRSVRLTSSAALRCVSDLEIGDRFRMEFARAGHLGGVISVDVLGLKLFRFLSDQLFWISESGHPTHIRLLMQHPDGEIFEQICEAEARSVDATRRDMARTLNSLRPSATRDKSLLWDREALQVEVRLFNRYQPVTMFGVDSTIYVRPRVSTPQGASSRFYEVYDESDSRAHFGVHHSHFETCWEESSYSMPLSIHRLLAETPGVIDNE